MFATALLAVPLALLWMVVTASVSVESFVVGLLLGFAILLLIRWQNVQVDARRLSDQVVGLAVYTVTLGRDIFVSSVDVARRVLSPEIPLNPGIIAVDTQDRMQSDVTAAFSAHGITITPGELVVDFDGSHTMYVHCLDVEMSSKNAEAAQTKRLRMLCRILGRSDV